MQYTLQSLIDKKVSSKRWSIHCLEYYYVLLHSAHDTLKRFKCYVQLVNQGAKSRGEGQAEKSIPCFKPGMGLRYKVNDITSFIPLNSHDADVKVMAKLHWYKNYFNEYILRNPEVELIVCDSIGAPVCNAFKSVSHLKI